MNRNIENKKGITLIVLIITIIVALILIVSAVFAASSAIDDTSVVSFARDITEVQNAVESYYIANNELPIDTAAAVMSRIEFETFASSRDLVAIEVTENKDSASEFYILDLDKLGINRISFGNLEHGNNDVLVVAYPSLNVYYPHGLPAKGTKYFSISSKISKVSDIDLEEKDESITTIISSGILDIKQTKNWTNNMGVEIKVNMQANEELYMSVSGSTNRLITTSIGDNEFGFDLLSGIVNNVETIKVPTLTMTEANYIEQKTRPVGQRYVDITKFQNGQKTATTRLDFERFTLNAPEINYSDLFFYPDMNVGIYNLCDTCGIKEVRYEYIKKYTELGTVVDYTPGLVITEEYMRSKAKIANIDNLEFTIKAPKNVETIAIAIIDYAGNVTIYNEEYVDPAIYLGYTINSSKKSALQLTANIFTYYGVKDIIFSTSTDGINFSNSQTVSRNLDIEGTVIQQSNIFTGFNTNVVYVKIESNFFDASHTETRIIKVNLEDENPLGLGKIATVNSTYDGKAAKYNNPIIPLGFKAINEGTVWPNGWNSGLVIEDNLGNQFVWVPVDGYSLRYIKWTTLGIAYNNVNVSDDSLPSGVANEIYQINRYGGFYVARYEAGNNSGTLVSKKGATAWDSINYTIAKSTSESMINNSNVKSGLITGTQWDTLMNWAKNSGKNVLDSRDWGNYNNSISPANVSGSGTKQTTGYSEYWKVNNIYDLAGNVREWTNENFSTSRNHRGGNYNQNGTSAPAATRDPDVVGWSAVGFGFRPVLYVQ